MKYVLFVDMKTISCSERDIEKILEKRISLLEKDL